ncbi:MAG TPA: DUF6292 family protein [Streptosporangiaceae bacterium]|nr:DUF6292 family protein [Streptosporangiaceae bacterium]
MKDSTTPPAHPDPWVDVLRGYVTRSVEALTAEGLMVERSWLDPRNPRDATIIFTHPASNVSAEKLALVWDEVTGWRRGVFESGQQGIRTVLSSTTYLGGGILPDGQELVSRVLAGTSEPRREHRSVADVRDGLDDALRTQG